MALYHLGIFNCKQTQMLSRLHKGRFEIIRMHCGDEETIDWTRISLEEPGKLQRAKKPNADPGWTREQSDETTTTVKRKLEPILFFFASHAEDSSFSQCSSVGWALAICSPLGWLNGKRKDWHFLGKLPVSWLLCHQTACWEKQVGYEGY